MNGVLLAKIIFNVFLYLRLDAHMLTCACAYAPSHYCHKSDDIGKIAATAIKLTDAEKMKWFLFIY